MPKIRYLKGFILSFEPITVADKPKLNCNELNAKNTKKRINFNKIYNRINKYVYKLPKIAMENEKLNTTPVSSSCEKKSTIS